MMGLCKYYGYHVTPRFIKIFILSLFLMLDRDSRKRFTGSIRRTWENIVAVGVRALVCTTASRGHICRIAVRHAWSRLIVL